jgi:hypothetical protein
LDHFWSRDPRRISANSRLHRRLFIHWLDRSGGLVSGSPEQLEPSDDCARNFSLCAPNGPIWLIAVFAALEGSGFGMAWTFILRSTIKHAESNGVQRFQVVPTVQRIGYALGGQYRHRSECFWLALHGDSRAAQRLPGDLPRMSAVCDSGLIAMAALMRNQPSAVG